MPYFRGTKLQYKWIEARRVEGYRSECNFSCGLDEGASIRLCISCAFSLDAHLST